MCRVAINPHWCVCVRVFFFVCVQGFVFFFFSTVPLVQAEHLFPDKADVDE